MPTIPYFPPPLRAPIGWITVNGQRVPVTVEEQWGVWFRTGHDLNYTSSGVSISDLDGVSLTAAQKTDLTDGGDSALHFHPSDRARSNHTGTQLVATISDFNAELVRNPILAVLMAGA